MEIGDQSTVSAGDAVFGRIYERVVNSARDEAIVEYGNQSIVAAAARIVFPDTVEVLSPVGPPAQQPVEVEVHRR